MKDEVSEKLIFFLLERTPGAWVLPACRRSVACCPSLDLERRPHSAKKKQEKAHNLSVGVGRSDTQDNQDGVKIIMLTGNNGKRDMAAEIICQQTSNPDYTF